MLIKAEQKNTRYSPQKARLIANAVKSLPLDQAIDQLAVMQKKGSDVLLKVLRQAMANATHNYGLSVADLEINEIIVNQGPMYKRFRAVSRGRAHSIIKKTCHVKVILKTKQEVSDKVAKLQSRKEEVKNKNSKVKSTSQKEKVTTPKGVPMRAPKAEKANITKGGSTAKIVTPRTTSK